MQLSIAGKIPEYLAQGPFTMSLNYFARLNIQMLVLYTFKITLLRFEGDVHMGAAADKRLPEATVQILAGCCVVPARTRAITNRRHGGPLRQMAQIHHQRIVR